VILLAFIFQTGIRSTIGIGSIRGEGEEFLEERFDVVFSLPGGFVAVGACFDLGQDYLILATGGQVDIW
jgi:predicted amidohydrolase